MERTSEVRQGEDEANETALVFSVFRESERIELNAMASSSDELRAW